jgi:hypothetical protein
MSREGGEVMFLCINYSPFGVSVGDTEVESKLQDLISWIKNPTREDDPREIFGETCTLPIKVSQDEELGGIWNCSEWMIVVDSYLTVITAILMIVNGKITQQELGVMIDGRPIDNCLTEFLYETNSPYRKVIDSYHNVKLDK